MTDSSITVPTSKYRYDLSKRIPVGMRNASLTSLGGTLRNQGQEYGIIRETLRFLNENWTEEPLPEVEVDRIAESVSRYPKGPLRTYPESEEPKGTRRLRRTLLGDALRDGVPEPEVFEDDVLLKGKVHQVFSGPGSGKSWFALWLAAHAIARKQTVLYLDMENGYRIISERLQDLDVGGDVDQYLNYYDFPALGMGRDATGEYTSLLDEIQPALIVFDSWVNFLAASGLDENSNTDVERWSNAYVHPARIRGCTIVLLDHIPHEGNHSRGATRKKDMVDVQWRLKKTRDFDRTQVGYIQLTREKDREGWLPERVGFSLGGTEEGFLFKRSAGAAADPGDGLTENQRIALGALVDGATWTEWRKASGFNSDSSFDNARKALLNKKRVRYEDDRYYSYPNHNSTETTYEQDKLLHSTPPPLCNGGGGSSSRGVEELKREALGEMDEDYT